MTKQSSFFQRAKPLWGEGLEGQMNVVLFFVCSFSGCEAKKLVLAGNNFFRVFLNGSFIAYGPERAAHGYNKVETISLPALQKTNRLVIEVSSSYCKSFYALKTSPFLQAELRDSSSNVIRATGQDFKIYRNASRYQKVARYSYQRAFSESYHFTPEERDFLRKDNGAYPEISPREVEEPILEKRTLPQAEYRDLAFAPFERGTFRKEATAPVHDDRYFHDEALGLYTRKDFDIDPDAALSPLVFRKESGSSSELKAGEFITYRSAANPAGFIALSLNVIKPSKVALLFDEYDCGKNVSGACDLVFYRNTVENFITYDLEAGSYDLLSFEPYVAKYIRVLFLSGEGEILSTGLKTYQAPKNPRFHFISSQPEANVLMAAAERTYLENSVDLLMDCPSRERAGWLFDSGFTALSESLFQGSNIGETAFLRNFLHFDHSQVEEGMMPMCYPADFTDKSVSFIHQWSLWYILELAANEERNGTTELIKESKNNVLSILDFFAKHENREGLLEHLPYNNYIEASLANDPKRFEGVNFPTAMLYVGALEAANRLYPELRLAKKINRLKAAINADGFKDGFYLDSAHTENGVYVPTAYRSEAAQYYAFYFGIATPASRPELRDTLLKQFGPHRNPCKTYPDFVSSNMLPGIFLRLFVLNSLEKYPEKVVQEAIDYCYDDAALTGTLWENATPSSSLNHGFASVLAPILLQPLFGLKEINRPHKEIILLKTFIEKEGSVSIPVSDDSLKIEVHQGQRKINPPQGYRFLIR
jgi:alpha-L-rhamnosidase